MTSEGDDLVSFEKREAKNAKQENGQESHPEDKNNVVYLVFILYGAGVLTPWNVVASCFDYFLLFDSPD